MHAALQCDERQGISMMIERGSAPGAARVPPGALGAWWREGVRTAMLRPPRWASLHAHPVVIAMLLAAWVLLAVLLQRVMIPGPAIFNASAIHVGWAGTLLALWLCWLVTSQAPGDGSPDTPAPTAVTLFGVLLAQGLFIEAVSGAVLVPLMHAGWLAPDAMPRGLAWTLWLAPWAWTLIAQCVLLLRFAPARRALRLFVVLASCAPLALNLWSEPPSLWQADESAEHAAAAPRFRITQELIERQAPVLATKLHELQPQRPGVVDLYGLTFAPYAGEDVFKRESAMVAEVMRERFDAPGRVVQLVNHRDTMLELPWATPLNLQRAIERIASVMDRDEDVLFIHLTSHGAGNGELSASFWPLDVETVTPQALKRWLDAAGVRFRVISVSACYSGSWIEPLEDSGTLIMTASDGTHTSYGCGRKSELTFFGRAVYNEQLRHTLSFESAHAAARKVIEQREGEAGKTDGYSNPQISVGAAIREPLARLEARLAARSEGTAVTR
jgi:Peptidase C13 family